MRAVAPLTFARLVRNPLYAGRIYAAKLLAEPIEGDFETVAPPEVFDRAQGVLEGRRSTRFPGADTTPSACPRDSEATCTS